MTSGPTDRGKFPLGRPAEPLCALYSYGEAPVAPKPPIADGEASTGLKIDPAILTLIGLRLRYERQRLNYTQTNFGNLCHVSTRGYLKWEKGECSPPASALHLLGIAGADPLFIITGERSSPVGNDLLPSTPVSPAQRPGVAPATGLEIDPAILLTIIAEQTRTIEAAQATIRLLLDQAGGTGSTGAGA